MRQKLDFSLLVLTSCILVLTLEPPHPFPSDRGAATPELSPQSGRDRVEQVEDSLAVRPSPGAQIVAGSEERILRLLQQKNDEGLGWS
ncbi:MAG: hypothetical protein SVX43_15775 [Cyanobacteriota bacterium]|nr:hypothetical protein [Cyanobacteriota bacterium]